MFLDTHAAVFLHAGELSLFTETALYLIEKEDLFISPMACLELQYLYEVGRIGIAAAAILSDLESELSLRIADRRWMEVVSEAMKADWTRDPFDRLIAAQAIVEKQRLLSRDRDIQSHCSLAFW
jgi:PIN domain nuclease of toxin-antitoxin system